MVFKPKDDIKVYMEGEDGIATVEGLEEIKDIKMGQLYMFTVLQIIRSTSNFQTYSLSIDALECLLSKKLERRGYYEEIENEYRKLLDKYNDRDEQLSIEYANTKFRKLVQVMDTMQATIKDGEL